MIQLHRFFFLLLEKRSTKTTQSDNYAPVIHPGMNSLSKLKFPGLPAVTHGLIDTSCSCTPLVQVSVLFSQILTQPKTKQRVQICKKERIVVITYNVGSKTSGSDPTPVRKHPDFSTRIKQRTVMSQAHNFIYSL